MGSPIYSLQNPIIAKNHQRIKEISQYEVETISINGTSVEHAKQIMYKKFLESDCDYFFNVDADIYFYDLDISPIDILISNNKDIIGGIYVCKKFPFRPAHRPLDLQKQYEEKGEFPEDYIFKIPKEVHEVQWLAGGCMLIKREVIEKLMKKFLVPNLPMTYKKEYLSEDFGFCQRSRELGYKIYADPRIKLGHQGPYIYTLDNYKNI